VPDRHPRMRWWGWGVDADAIEIPEHAREFLGERVGLAGAPRPPVALEDVSLPEPALSDGIRDRLVAIAGDDGVRDDREARVVHAAGKSYPDLVRQRAGEVPAAPDAVVLPGSHEDVRAVLDLCAAEGIAVVPFGGGTSVVGGVDALRGSHGAVIALDLGRMDALLAFDERSRVASFEPGIRAPEADAVLARRGYTLGHIPQSYEYVSLGGCVATRSAGQASTGFGRIDEMTYGVRLAAPAGDVDLAPLPPSAAGPQLRQLVVGSEGALGVLTRVDLRVRPVQELRWQSWMFPTFHDGAEALRELEQGGCAPAVARLSDADETNLSFALAGPSVQMRAFAAFLRARSVVNGSLAIAGWAGDESATASTRAEAGRILRRHGAVATGKAPALAWVDGRFRSPYLRDALLEHGVMAETLETATLWSNLERVHGAVRDALRESLGARGTPPLVMCHVSHLYPVGASLYFTWIARQQGDAPIEQWRAAKSAACDAIVASGGTLTHHHAIGRDHVPWMEAEVGEGGLRLLRAAKDELDPAGIMNPGKLLPEPAG
jgi:alkyldihydroxyacetonephosphate synthase